MIYEQNFRSFYVIFHQKKFISACTYTRGKLAAQKSPKQRIFVYIIPWQMTAKDSSIGGGGGFSGPPHAHAHLTHAQTPYEG